MSKVKFLVIAVCVLSFNLLLRAEPIEIIFTASNPPILTLADTYIKIEKYVGAELVTKGFIAIIDDDVTVIGDMAFYTSKPNPKSYWFREAREARGQNVTTIGNMAFMNSDNLLSVNFPLVTTIGNLAFSIGSSSASGYSSLESLSFGTGLEAETEINFGSDVFLEVPTQNVDLILGENVLPLPDTVASTWHCDRGDGTGTPYVWKSITIKKVSVEEATKNLQVNIFPNPTVDNATVSFELEKSCNLKIILTDLSSSELFTVYDAFTVEGNFSKTFSTKNLSSGIYFLQILIDGKYTVAKLVVE